MDTQRIILIAAFAMVTLMLWQSWDVLNHPEKYKPQTQVTQQSSQTENKDNKADTPQIPQQEDQQQTPDIKKQAGSTQQISQKVKVQTDLLEIELDSKGADVVKAILLAYPKEEGNGPVVLMDRNPQRFFISQTGILNKDNIKQYAPDHHTVYQIEKQDYELGNQEQMTVTFKWQSEDAKMQVTKTYEFKKGRYDIKVRQQIINQSDAVITGYVYRQLQRNRQANKSMFLQTYTGGMIYREGGGFEKYSFDDMIDEPLKRYMDNGWLAMIEHYFLASWIPQADQKQHYYSRVYTENYQQRFILGMTTPAFSIQPGKEIVIEDTLYIGPKLQKVLKEIAPNLDDTVDYGFLAVIGHPIFWLLDKIHGFVNNWGWSIIILTLIIKLIFYKLSEYSYRSMAEMRKLAPKLKALQEQHKDNPQAKNQALMKMYKEEKINPLGGCLPVLVQIPVFIALYWVLLESVELRQADFILWLTNLSVPDPYFILPLLMGVTMFIQQKLNPPPSDPIQEKVMLMLPFIFTVFFAFFPAGLVLYWVTNNILSILQQWYITRQIENK